MILDHCRSRKFCDIFELWLSVIDFFPTADVSFALALLPLPVQAAVARQTILQVRLHFVPGTKVDHVLAAAVIGRVARVDACVGFTRRVLNLFCVIGASGLAE